MDKVPYSSTVADTEQLQVGSFSPKQLIEQSFEFGRRQYPLIVLIVACTVALGLLHLLTTPKLYTAHAMFLIDTSKVQVLQQQQQVIGELPLDTAQVETQIEVLKSDGIARSVVKDLKLAQDPEFTGSQTGFIGALFGWMSSGFSESSTSSSGASEDALIRRAVGRLQGNRDVKRVGRTYVLDLSYTSPSPSRAASVANAIGDAYLVDQLDAKYQASQRASKWLQDRISELRQQAMNADRAVLEFKEKNHIVDAGTRNGGDGQLLTDQRVVNLNAQLVQARADTAEAKARLDRIQDIMNQDVPDAAVTDSLNNSVINALRTQYLEYDRRLHIYTERYGATHLAVINLQTQIAQLRRSMNDELGRIGESYKSNYEIAKSREDSLSASLDQQIAGSQLTNRERLGLDELESRAKAFHSIHDSFLQRYMEVTQQQSLPITEARTITAAAPPGAPSSPKTNRVLLMAGALGLMLGVGAAFLRESVDHVFRTSRQVEQILKTNCLAVLPAVKSVAAPASGKFEALAKSGREVQPIASELFRHVIDDPLSWFAEGFRAIKVAADIAGAIKQNKVIGITSSLPHEGKSTVASNFAAVVAHGGRKVILIDGDLRNPTLTRKLVSKPEVGLLEVLAGKVGLRQVIHTDEATGMAFLPAVIDARWARSSEIVASDAFRELLDGLRKVYDYIIIDLPPLAPVVDARAASNIVDSYVFVIEWGRTRLNMVQRQLGNAPEVFERLLGVVLNKANSKVLRRYEDYYGRYYYSTSYRSQYGYGYGHDD
jgi:succinoglycan biosynthesis transport protein ExoP